VGELGVDSPLTRSTGGKVAQGEGGVQLKKTQGSKTPIEGGEMARKGDTSYAHLKYDGLD